jgi:hypothetical protein
MGIKKWKHLLFPTMNTGIGNEREVESQGLIVEEKFLSLVY